ncbi:glycosyltransferase [Halorubrum sp. Ea8]|uniref:glycosyltransferase n=1 Tax=Halorubrum sp. Ea8 TaxID=1383841 RepID=UPI000B97EF23|nr:glycosyltransferase [Halorubrum sp. Ea8]OYR44599.1 glycosyl transferase [Halorubrum sp. Ea8]
MRETITRYKLSSSLASDPPAEHSPELAESGSLADQDEGSSPLLSFFIPRLGQGGAEQVAINLVNGLSARGYNVELLVTQTDGGLHSQLSSDVNVVTLPPSKSPVLGVAMNFPALVDYLRRKEPALLLSHLSRANVISIAACRLIDADTVVAATHHDAFGTGTENGLKDRALKRLVPLLYPSADRIIAVSEGVADSIVERTKVKRDNVSVLHNPIEIDAIREQARRDVEDEWITDDDLDVVLYVGRHTEQKDLKTWLRAFERVQAQNPDTRAIIAGKGPKREEIQSYSERLGLADVVSIPGYVENAYGYMHEADVFLLSSRYEGLPSVLIEALACGCPVVATDCPSGPKEILDDGKYGCLRPVGDANGLAEAVLETLNQSTPRDELMSRADGFATGAVLDRYEQFLEEYVLS